MQSGDVIMAKIAKLKTAKLVKVVSSRATALSPHPDYKNPCPDIKTVVLSWRNTNREDLIRLAGELLRTASSEEFKNNPRAQVNLTGFRFLGRNGNGFKTTVTLNDK